MVAAQEACHFRDLAADFAAVGAQPVGISGDAVGRQHAFASTHSLGYPLLSDTGHKVAKALGAYRWFLPGGLHTRRITFVIGQDGGSGPLASETTVRRARRRALTILRRPRPRRTSTAPVVTGPSLCASVVVAADPFRFSTACRPAPDFRVRVFGTVRGPSRPQRLVRERGRMTMLLGLAPTDPHTWSSST